MRALAVRIHDVTRGRYVQVEVYGAARAEAPTSMVWGTPVRLLNMSVIASTLYEVPGVGGAIVPLFISCTYIDSATT